MTCSDRRQAGQAGRCGAFAAPGSRWLAMAFAHSDWPAMNSRPGRRSCSATATFVGPRRRSPCIAHLIGLASTWRRSRRWKSLVHPDHLHQLAAMLRGGAEIPAPPSSPPSSSRRKCAGRACSCLARGTINPVAALSLSATLRHGDASPVRERT